MLLFLLTSLRKISEQTLNQLVMGKILEITEMKPQPATLPDGVYIGKWGGHVIELIYAGVTYYLKTEESSKGLIINVVVTVGDRVATYQKAKNQAFQM